MTKKEMPDLLIETETMCGGKITFDQRHTEEGDDIVAVNTMDGAGGRGWYVGLNKEQCREVIIDLAKCMAGRTE